MGRMIASLLPPQHKIVSIIDHSDTEATHTSITADALQNADVVIDFSHPSGALNNIDLVASIKKNMVMGTTGWYAELDAVKKIVSRHNIGFLYASNFSIGVQLFLKLVERAGQLFNPFPQYDVFAHEFHHNQKVDSPSGTALSVGKTILQTMPRKKEIFADTAHEKMASDKLHLTSTRGGSIPGTHEVFFDSEADTVEIRHIARSRAGFALGAIRAAEWLNGKRGFFTMEDFLNH